jgi:hypothetical protein
MHPAGLKTYIYHKPCQGTLITPFPNNSKLEVTKMSFDDTPPPPYHAMLLSNKWAGLGAP